MRFHDYLYDIGIRDFKSVTGSIINTYILSLARYSTTYVSESLREIRRLLTLDMKMDLLTLRFRISSLT